MEDVKEEFLYCSVLKTTATAQDEVNSISEFFETEGLQWEKLCGVCTDGAPAMLGSKSGFQMKVKKISSSQRSTLHNTSICARLQDSSKFFKKCTQFCCEISQFCQEGHHLSSIQTALQRNEL